MKLDTRDTARYEKFTRRSAILSLGSVGIFAGLTARMYVLQVLQKEQFWELAEENRVNRHLLPPLRGRILDRFGVELATNRQNFQVLLIPERTNDVDLTLDKVSLIVPLSEDRRKRIKRDIKRKPAFVPVRIAENLTWEQFAEVNVHAAKLAGIQPGVGDARDYPYNDRLAHVVGYVARPTESDLSENKDPLLQLPGFRIGKSGLEKTNDDRLRGEAGTSHVVVNAYGRVIEEFKRNEGMPGEDMVLTLDMGLQEFVYDRLDGQSASVVVMDIHTGDLLSFASTPAYNPNEFSRGLSQKSWDALRTDEMTPLLNKTLAGQYAPGSTFKIVTSLAGLEGGQINPSKIVMCRGRTYLGRHEFNCWKKEGHGPMDLRNAIKNSCNVYFFEQAKRMKIDDIAAMAQKFGLGQTYDFGVPDSKKGLVPTSSWKKAAHGIPWVGGDTLNVAIGQGYLLVTPMHQAVMVARLANGGKAVEPRLMRSIGEEVQGQQEAFPDMGLKPHWVRLVQNGLAAVVNEPGGTAYGKRLTEEGLSMAGKTGTVQVRRISREERRSGVIKNDKKPWRERDHGWFVGYGPIENPRYAISVFVEHGGGGSSAAAPVAQDIMRETLLRNPSVRPAVGPIALGSGNNKRTGG